MRLLLLLAVGLSAQSLEEQHSGTKASFRGISAVNSRIAWASGSRATVVRTVDGGANWRALPVTGAPADLDFRDIHAWDDRRAVILSAGPGDKSRLYGTTDGGTTWRLLFTNPDATGFLDAVAFWDRKRGLILGDPVNGQFTILATTDGGNTWHRRPAPPAMADEGAFAASGTCLVVGPGGRAWFATGGPNGARVFRSTDYGQSWQVSQTPLKQAAPGAGVFGLTFEGKDGVAVGGNYEKAQDAIATAAITTDGGATWTPANAQGFRSAVVFTGQGGAIAVGSHGVSYSSDSGKTWQAAPGSRGYHTMSRAKDGAVFVAGSEGRIARYR